MGVRTSFGARYVKTCRHVLKSRDSKHDSPTDEGAAAGLCSSTSILRGLVVMGVARWVTTGLQFDGSQWPHWRRGGGFMWPGTDPVVQVRGTGAHHLQVESDIIWFSDE